MSFITLEFIIFAFVAISVYFWIPNRYRNVALFIASYYFYSRWQATYLLLIIFSTLVDYVVGRLIHQTPQAQSRRRRIFLSMSIVTNLGVLFIFKYYNFFTDAIITTLTSLGLEHIIQFSTLDVLLPVGISFYTFQSMSYTIDIFRRKLEPEHDFVRFATYVAFFPQLVAGPIERATNLLPQFRRDHQFDVGRAVIGMRQVLWGAFKKVVIADRLAILVNAVFSDPTTYDGTSLLLASVFFTIQIYCDFSGYSDIAIGTARIMGFDLMENFRQPYFSRSIREFWRRWHISLSTWFRDYLYIPLGGNRVSEPRMLLNFMIVFVVSGLWHGAAWTFVIWGFLHGIMIVLETIFSKRVRMPELPVLLDKGWQVFSVLWVFIIVVIAFIFFRAESLSDAIYVISNFHNTTNAFDALRALDTDVFPAIIELFLCLFVIAVLFLVDSLFLRMNPYVEIAKLPSILRWIIYQMLLFAIFFSYGLYNINLPTQFIYFQF